MSGKTADCARVARAFLFHIEEMVDCGFIDSQFLAEIKRLIAKSELHRLGLREEYGEIKKEGEKMYVETQYDEEGKIYCHTDGKYYHMLKSPLKAANLTPEQYRAKYGLHPDSPMVSPTHSAKRSRMAKEQMSKIQTQERENKDE